MNNEDLFRYLCAKSAQYQTHLKPLPRQHFKKAYWLGVGFELSGNYFAAPLAEVIEIVNTPQLTPVPGVQPWLCGAMNLRGRLVPVYDLQGFLSEKLFNLPQKFQVLIVPQNEFLSGVLVKQLTGLLRFSDQDWHEKAAEIDVKVDPYVMGCYERRSELWRIFSVKKFVEERSKTRIGVELNG